MDNILGYYIIPHIPEVISEISDSNINRLEKTSEACDKIGKEISEIKPETIVILSSHGNLGESTFTINMGKHIYGDFKEFRNIDISLAVELDNVFAQGIIDCFKNNSINYIINNSDCNNYKLDHGSMVPLYFIDKYYKNYKLVTISSSIKDNNTLGEVGKAIRKVCEKMEKNIVVIVSCDTRINGQLRPMHRRPHKKEINQRNVVSNNDFPIFKEYNDESKKFKELKEYYSDYMSFIDGTLEEKKISEISLSYEESFGFGYAVMKIKPK